MENEQLPEDPRIGMIDRIKSVTLRQAFVLLLVLSSFAPMGKGIWEFGLDNRWWGNGKTEQEAQNICLMKKHITQDPIETKLIINKPTDKLVAKIYEGGDTLLIRATFHEDGSPAGQRMNWFPADTCIPKPEMTTMFNFYINEAYAATLNGPMTEKDFVKANTFEDKVTATTDYTVTVERTFPDGCKQVLIIDIATGNVNKIIEDTCKK